MILHFTKDGVAYEESSYRATQNYKLLCEFSDNSTKSVCQMGDEIMLARIIRNVFLDKPVPGASYNFDYNPPNVDGQIGVPQIVDKILGKFSKMKLGW